MAVVGAISQQIWDMKYRLQGPANGEPRRRQDHRGHLAPGGDRARRAGARAARAWAERVLRGDGRISSSCRPAASSPAPAPAARVTLFNCFVMGTIPDDMGGIFAHLREAALTMQQGGGIGYDFSTLRPRGAPVKGVGADASGPLSFMDVWDAMCRTIMSAGHRRGAMMATLALRPSRHRGLHRGQARARPAAHVQPLGAGHRRLHDGGAGGRALGADVRRHDLSRCCRRASCGTRSCARPTPMPSPA